MMAGARGEADGRQGMIRRHRALALVVVALAVLLASCGSDRALPELDLEPADHRAPQDHALKPRLDGPTAAERRAARILAVQQRAGAAYRFEPAAEGHEALNPAQRWRVQLSPDGARLETVRPDASWWLELRLAGVGRDGQLAAPALPARWEIRGNRAQVAHGGSVEAWYLNGPLGLEHGLVLRERIAGDGPLDVAFRLDGGLQPRLDAARGEITLDDEQGRAVLRYGELFARDADGTPLAARLELRGRLAYLRIDDAQARYPLLVDPLAWEEQDKLLPSSPVDADEFGVSVALSGDTAVIGAPHDGAQGSSAGAAYVFVRSAAAWSEQQKLAASDAAVEDRFGWAVAAEGDLALIGAPAYQAAPPTSAGAVYSFVRSAGTWSEQQKLEPPNGDLDDRFGWSIALEGAVALIGAIGDDDLGTNAGAVYVFARNAALWASGQKLTVNTSSLMRPFGGSTALSADTALIGAPPFPNWFPDCAPFSDGTAYVFHRSATTFTASQQLDGPPSEISGFGTAVGLSGDTAFVGAPCHDSGAGAVYRYVRTGSSWSEQLPPLTLANALESAAFGAAVAVGGNTALFGASWDEYLGPSGAAYVFTRDGASWVESDRLGASDPHPGAMFGTAVALSDDTALIGAPYGGDPNGAAYAFRYALELGSSCTADSECASGACSDEVCCESHCHDMPCMTCAATDHEGTCVELPAGAVGHAGCVYRCDGVNGDCPFFCGDDADCIPSHYCELAQCVPRLLGEPCTDDSECVSGHCADQVCCDSACADPCLACLAAYKESGPDGTCGPAPAGTDPRDGCAAAEDPTTCGADGLCDGQGQCRTQTPAGGSCESGVCHDTLLVHSTCDEAGDCVRQSTVDCSPYQCAEPGECPQSCGSTADCMSGLICDWSSQCVPPPVATDGDGGCGCRAVGRPVPRGWGSIAALLLMVARGRSGRAGRSPTPGRSRRRR